MRHTISSLHYPSNRSPNNVGHLELKDLSTHGEASCKLCSMYNTRYMSHVNYIEHVQIKLLIFFVKIVVRRFASHILNTFNKKWQQVKPMRIQENGQTFFLFHNYIFGYISKKWRHSLFGAWSFFLVYILFTPSEGPKGFENWFFKKSDHESWTIKLDRGKRPSSMVRLHGPWWKPDVIWIMSCISYIYSHTYILDEWGILSYAIISLGPPNPPKHMKRIHVPDLQPTNLSYVTLLWALPTPKTILEIVS